MARASRKSKLAWSRSFCGSMLNRCVARENGICREQPSTGPMEPISAVLLNGVVAECDFCRESRKDLMDDISENIRQSIVAAAVAISKPSVIDPKKMKYCGVEIVDVDTVVGHGHSMII